MRDSRRGKTIESKDNMIILNEPSERNIKESARESNEEGKQHASHNSFDFIRNNSNLDLQPIYKEIGANDTRNPSIRIEWKKTGSKFAGSQNPIMTLSSEQGLNTQRDHSVRRSISSLDQSCTLKTQEDNQNHTSRLSQIVSAALAPKSVLQGSISKAKLDRPGLPKSIKDFIGPTKYSPNKAFIQPKSRTIAKNTEERFDSLAYRNKVNNEQVGPHSYNTYSQENLSVQQLKPTNYKVKFTRDSRGRLNSRCFLPNRDMTPSPQDSNTRFATGTRFIAHAKIEKLLVAN